jgi:hypothetical protein
MAVVDFICYSVPVVNALNKNFIFELLVLYTAI